MRYRAALLGWAEPPPDERSGDARYRDGPTVSLDWQRFRYAGKFRTSATGKAVARETRVNASRAAADADSMGSSLVAAAAFNADRTDRHRLRIRYVTVRDDRQGHGVGAGLLAFVADKAGSRGYAEIAIAVNNPRAYVAAAKAGFAYDGTQVGLSELVCRRLAGGPPRPVDSQSFASGIQTFKTASEQTVSDRYRRGHPPAPVEPLADTLEAGD